MKLIIELLIKAFVLLVTTRLVPGFNIDSWTTALKYIYKAHTSFLDSSCNDFDAGSIYVCRQCSSSYYCFKTGKRFSDRVFWHCDHRRCRYNHYFKSG